MLDKPPSKKDSLLELIEKLWLPVAGFLGAITTVYNFYKMWLGDQAAVTYFMVGGGLFVLVLALGWVVWGRYTTTRPAVWPIGTTITETHWYFSPSSRKAALIGLGAIVLLGAIGTFSLIQQREAQKVHLAEQEKKFIVVIPVFEGPEDVYGLRNEIIENLNSAFSKNENVEIIPIDDLVTPPQGSQYARQLGKEHLADMVIWGWYRPTENPNVTIHIETLFEDSILAFDDSTVRKPTASMVDLKSFELQQKVGKESVALVLFLLGVVYTESDDNALAISCFDQALDRISDDVLSNKAIILFYRGRAEIGNSRQNARRYLDQAIEADQTFAGAYMLRGIILFNLEQYDQAVLDYNKTLELDPQATGAIFLRGFAYHRMDQYELALADYTRSIEINPTVYLSYDFRADVYRELNQYENALADFTKAAELNPQDAWGYQGQGTIYASLKQYDNAIASYSQAVKNDPADADTYLLRAQAYIELKQFEEALLDLSTAISIDPSNYDYYLWRGTTYNSLGRNDEALADLDRGIQMSPSNGTGYYLRGLTYTSMNKQDSAILDFTKALQLLPNFPDVYNARGVSYSAKGDLDLAILDFSRAIELDEDNPMYYQNRRTAYTLLGKQDNADADFLKYKELTGQNEP